MQDTTQAATLRPLIMEMGVLYDALKMVEVQLPGSGLMLNTMALNIQSKHHGCIAAHADKVSTTFAATTATSAPRSLTVLTGLAWAHGLEHGDLQIMDGSNLHAILEWTVGGGGVGSLKCAYDDSAYRFSATAFAR
tara:strand:+ start:174 stop:581 length:408 start_codon:yes stop_codon:yes gene_type:complete